MLLLRQQVKHDFTIRLSLQATRQHLDNFSSQWDGKTNKKAKKIYRIMLEKVADSYEEIRVGRVEPFVKKTPSQSLSINARTSECSEGKNEISLRSGFRLNLVAFINKQLFFGNVFIENKLLSLRIKQLYSKGFVNPRYIA
ncbi:hypothetical protein [Gloeothece citriformis]|uniref:hypothetical protein n=1 Tax=Gloeothece citriformis TaxID=2546356 RepID=UPI00059B6AE5|nr:hypothetical protein [Gloeothece citriformis]